MNLNLNKKDSNNEISTKYENIFKDFIDENIWHLTKHSKSKNIKLLNFIDKSRCHENFLKEIEYNLIKMDKSQIESYIGRIFDIIEGFNSSFIKSQINYGSQAALNTMILDQKISNDECKHFWYLRTLHHQKALSIFFLENELEMILNRISKVPLNIQYYFYFKKIELNIEETLISEKHWDFENFNHLTETTNLFINSIETRVLSHKNRNDYLNILLNRINSYLIKIENVKSKNALSSDDYRLYYYLKNISNTILPKVCLHKLFIEVILSEFDNIKYSDYNKFFPPRKLDDKIVKSLDIEMKEKISTYNKAKINSLKKIKNVILELSQNPKENNILTKKNNEKALTLKQSLLLFNEILNLKIEDWNYSDRTKKAKLISKLLNSDYDNTYKGLSLLEKKKSETTSKFKEDEIYIKSLIKNTLLLP